MFLSENRAVCDVRWINSLSETITFTSSDDKNSVNFFNVVIFRASTNVIHVKPFRKPTDQNTYLHFRSFYPGHLKRNIQFGQFLFIKWNATDPEDYLQHGRIMANNFLERQCPKNVVSNAFMQARDIDRNSLLQHKMLDSKNKTQRLWSDIDYIMYAASIRNIILKHWHVIKNLPGCSLPPLIGFKN